ncbi:MAG: hypothetical protein KF713_08650 [Turneriella sp.]|nr:hypothetical protein [Turneriella sp.]
MRTAFVNQLLDIAANDSRVWLVNGDLGYKVLDSFREMFPERFINAGVAEQNMMGLSAGLALSGKIVFVYSIANFPTFRCLEQIRNDICYHNVNVKIISVGAGYTYGSHGYTHHGVEDMGIMRLLPNMRVVAPGDPVEAELATKKAYKVQGPVYMRLGKAGEPILHKGTKPTFDFGSSITMSEGTDISLIATGGVLELAVHATESLQNAGISVRLISMPCIKPFDQTTLLAAVNKSGGLITLEEHALGGLATCVSEVMAMNQIAIKYKPLYLSDDIIIQAGSQNDMRAQKGLTVENVTNVARSMIAK